MGKDINMDLLEVILKTIVSKPEEIKIKKKVDENGVLQRVWADKGDMGRIIGKGGSTANAIMLIVKVVGYKEHVSIKIEEAHEKDKTT